MNVLGVPFNSAGHPDGVAKAPRVLREMGLIAQLQRSDTPDSAPFSSTPGRDVRDAGDVDVGVPRPDRARDSGLRALDSLEVMTASLRHAVAKSIRDGDGTLVIGGDCALLLGCLRGASDVVGEIGLLFIDGHEDAWPPARSTTGEAADCELGLALGLHRANLPLSLTRLLPALDPRAVVALGPRDAEDLVAHAIPSVAEQITVRTGEDLGDGDLTAFANDPTAHILQQVEHWWLHIDLDVLSTNALPAVDYPQSGGLSWPGLESLTAAALGAPGCLGVTVCIYNPDLDPDRRHARRIVDYIRRTCALLPSRVG